MEEDPKFKVDDETMQTILLKIMPPEYVKDMREQLAQGKHEDDYFSFEQMDESTSSTTVATMTK